MKTFMTGSAAEGSHELVWSGRDESGHLVGSGVYLLRLETDEGCLCTKVVRIQ